MNGIKQTVKVLQTGHVTEVFVALDADVRMTTHAVQVAQENGIPVVFVDSKRELGRACEIELGAAVSVFTEW
ncbi:ribosomal L7Ae/L30e/S12e/Gadd45 family protein [Rummeliibacillus sp. NPDC094406]|uniref:ribosomal L7Ae/L30e/S12e/Gadd45 family protein n=1 Tax=Rummeliibacillus TaxID=648802 RepID=UPI0037CAF8A8